MPNMYETMVVFDGTYDEDSAKNATARVESFLTENGAEITKTDVWGRRDLAYTIGKKRIGYYVLFIFAGDSELPGKAEKMFRADEKVLRHLTVEHDPDKRTASSLPKITELPREGNPGDDEASGRPRGRHGRDNDRRDDR